MGAFSAALGISALVLLVIGLILAIGYVVFGRPRRWLLNAVSFSFIAGAILLISYMAKIAD